MTSRKIKTTTTKNQTKKKRKRRRKEEAAKEEEEKEKPFMEHAASTGREPRWAPSCPQSLCLQRLRNLLPLKAKALKTIARFLLQPATFSASPLFPQPNTTAPPPCDLWDRLGFLFLKIYLFIYLWVCCVFNVMCGLFSSCSRWGLLSSHGVRASHCGGFSCGTQVLGLEGFGSCSFQALEHRLNSCGSHTDLVAPRQVGIFLDQGWNPCPLHCQADS